MKLEVIGMKTVSKENEAIAKDTNENLGSRIII
jgi:hypothetical protein